MPKQLLIYETAVPLSATRHADVWLDPGDSFEFTASLNAVPLMAVEFATASPEYAIVFTEQGDTVMPAAVLGVRNHENLYLSEDARWKADYVPAFIRRYPFVFASVGDGQTLTLCIDEAHPGVNRDQRGHALFGADGKPTAYLDGVLAFVKDYQLQFERTRLFCRRIRELGLLEPMKASVTSPGGEVVTLGGFLAASRDRLRALGGDALQQLAAQDELELLFLHLASLRNFNRVKDRLAGVQAAPAAAAAPAAPVPTGAAAEPTPPKPTRTPKPAAPKAEKKAPAAPKAKTSPAKSAAVKRTKAATK